MRWEWYYVEQMWKTIKMIYRRMEVAERHSWTMPDSSVTSSTGLTLMPECRCQTEAVDYRKKWRCRTNLFAAFRHLYLIFQHHIARITPSAAVYGRAGCITLNYLEFWRAVGILFTTINTSSMDVQGVFLSTASSMNVQGVSLSTASSINARGVSLSTARASSMNVQGVYPFPPPAVWTWRVYPFPPPAVWTCRVYPCPPPAVWTSRVYSTPFHHQQCECPGCIAVHRFKCGRAGCICLFSPFKKVF